MNFEFSYCGHGDISLRFGGDPHNIGNDYLRELPIMLWLGWLQCGRGNLFDVVDLPESFPDYMEDGDLERILENAVELARKVPLSLTDFNVQTAVEMFAGFHNGLNSVYYEFKLGEDQTLYLTRSFKDKSRSDDTILKLTTDDSEALLKDYFGFLVREERLVKFQGEMRRIVSVLSGAIR